MVSFSTLLKGSFGIMFCAAFTFTACSDDSSVGSGKDSGGKSSSTWLTKTGCAEETPFHEERPAKDEDGTDAESMWEYVSGRPCSLEEDEYADVQHGANSLSQNYYYVCTDDGWRRTHYLDYACFVKGLKVGDECVAYYSATDEKEPDYRIINRYVYTDCGWEKQCSSADDADCVKLSYVGDGSPDLESSPMRSCTKENELERMKIVGLVAGNPARYFVCKDGEWKRTGRVEYECPPEKAEVGDKCEYYNSSELDEYSYGRLVTATFTEEGSWDYLDDLPLDSDAYSGKEKCDDANEGAIDTLLVRAEDEQFSSYEFYKCVESRWRPIGESELHCAEKGVKTGDKCTYETVLYPLGNNECVKVTVTYMGHSWYGTDWGECSVSSSSDSEKSSGNEE